jgi:hypothetical protein
MSDEVAAPEMESGINVAVIPAGRVGALRATAELKPFSGVAVIVKDALLPARSVLIAGVTETVKSGLGAVDETVSAT